MALQEIRLTRKFVFNGMQLTDPSPEMNLEGVKRFYANQFLELLNSVIEGPVTKNNVSTYIFTRAAGAKGKGPNGEKALDVFKKMALGASDRKSLFSGLNQQQIEENIKCATTLKKVVDSSSTKHPLPLSQQAFGIWG